MTEDRLTERPPGRLGRRTEPSLAGDLLGHALFRLAPADVPAARKRPGPVPEGWERVPASLLRYSDEQTVASVAAVFAAIARLGRDPGAFEHWGVVAAPRFVGRANLAQAMRSFMSEGVWGVSPHLIPHFALHSPSGTISLALGLHGPNLGLGGGQHSAAEGFLAALTWLAAGTVPGVWLVLSGWSPELVPSRAGGTESCGDCLALALGLVPAQQDGGDRPRFQLAASTEPADEAAVLDLPQLARSLEPEGAPMSGSHVIASDALGSLRIELVPAAARAWRPEPNGHA